jgi:ABC-type multidrug transport system ATPase subunit
VDVKNESVAILVHQLCFSYDRVSSLSKPEIEFANLTVPRGAIYGLLGPSGCGKTTLLRCIIGRLKPHRGIIKVFGNKPGKS